MDVTADLSLENLSDSILPSQYNDLVRRRRSVLNGEYRLLWAVLEQAIRNCLANMECSTPNQRRAFDEFTSGFAGECLEAYSTFKRTATYWKSTPACY